MSRSSPRLAPACFPNATPCLQRTMRAAYGVIFLAIGGLAGCASGGTDYVVDVAGMTPTPLVDPLPLTVAVHYTPEFSAYTSKQESLNGDTWQVSFNSVQRDDMHRMLTSAFEEVIESPTAEPADDLKYDVLLIPRVENFSFLTPTESGTKFFAVSMRHFISFYGPEGTDFGAWEINSYGRSRNFFGRRVREMAAEACVDAMRDLATSLVVGLPEEIISREIVDVDGIELPGALQ
ncbi:MAG: hypothetical protein AB8G16_08660 [Gammaproteobacteria bacterium]